MDILTDFYKRYGHGGGVASVERLGTPFCIFKTKVAEVGLKTSFGASVAYRIRTDGRIVLSRTDTNLKESINISDIDRFHGEAWAEEIINLIKKLPPEGVGAELLLHQDIDDSLLAPKTLCAVSAYSKLLKNNVSPHTLLSVADKPPYFMASFTEGQIAVVNTQTKSFMTYNLESDKEKVIVIKSGKHRKPLKLPSKYYEREYIRIKAISGSLLSIGSFMYEASRDMLSYLPTPELDTLFNEILEFSKKVRILPDLSGAVVLLDKEKIDELIELVGTGYEKKTGLAPAFYISD